jgi:lysophospholipase L1-like esterase
VATCPDLGVIAPIPVPLRQLAGHWSRSLAHRQEAAVVRAGGVAVPIGRLISPEFVGHPELFASDHFHPSGAGYARAVAVLIPAVFLAIGEPVASKLPVVEQARPLIQADAQLLG